MFLQALLGCLQHRAAVAAVRETCREALGTARSAVLRVCSPRQFRGVVVRPAFSHAFVIGFALFGEGIHALEGFQAAIMQRQPFARMSDGGVPHELLQEVELFFGIASTLDRKSVV